MINSDEGDYTRYLFFYFNNLIRNKDFESDTFPNVELFKANKIDHSNFENIVKNWVNLQDFINTELEIQYTPIEKQNVSNNKGFKWFRENGKIHEKTEERLFNDPDFKKYSTFI